MRGFWSHSVGRLARLVDQRLRPGYLRFVSLTVLSLSVILLVVSFWTWDGTRTLFGPALGADFTGFYVAGTILNQQESDRIYELELQDQLYHRLLPNAPAAEKLPFVYPPFFALLLRPFAALPYAWAYLAWLGLSITLFLAGFVMTVRHTPTLTADDQLTALLLCLSFEPLLIECWLGGQTSAFGLFAMVMALHLEQRGRPLAGGFALSLCLYKPTLLVLILPMLVLAGRWRILSGFTAGGAICLALSCLAVGWRGCLDYGALLTQFTHATAGNSTVLRTWKYVDVVSFVRLLEGRLSVGGWAAIFASTLTSLVFLTSAWRRAPASAQRTSHRTARNALLWSGTLTWTMVFNLYVGIYDTVLILPGLLLTADVLRREVSLERRPFPATFKLLLTLLYVVPWFSPFFATHLRLQLDTLVLVATGAYQLALVPQIGRQSATSDQPG